MNTAAHDDSRTDQQLVDAINDGEVGAFDVLYWRYRDWVVRLAHRFSGNAEDTLDVLQDTFTYFYRRFPGFSLTSRLSTFLYPVVKNLALAARRKSGRFASDDPIVAQLPADQPDNALGLDFPAILADLSPIHREVLLMRFVDDMTIDEIAHALHIPSGTAKSRLHNAVEALRNDPRTRSLCQA